MGEGSLDLEVAVALQGTLDTFALPDVLRLLAATGKTGRLQIRGGRGGGEVWLDEGNIVGGTADALTFDTSDVVFELLRLDQGSFEFAADDVAPEGHDPVDVDEVITEAEVKLADWRVVEGVVPSLDYWVSLPEDLPRDQVTIDRHSWHTLVAIGEGRTIVDLDQQLGLGEIRVSNAVKALVDDGIVEIGEAPEPAQVPEPAVETVETVETVAEVDEPTDLGDTDEIDHTADTDGLGGSREVALDTAFDAEAEDHAYLTAGDSDGETLPEPLPAREDMDVAAFSPVAADPVPWNELAAEPFAAPPAPAVAGSPWGAPAQAEMADPNSHLATFSPKAAQALADAAEGEADPKAKKSKRDRTEEPMNRSLLMKFISSK